MARARNIKPGFFINDVLAEVPPLGRILFAGLWTIADREGRLEDRPRKIKAEVLPYDDCHIGELLDALAARGFIIRYTVNEQRFIQVQNFDKHQNPHVREPESVIPAPDEHSAGPAPVSETPEQTPDEHDAKSQNTRINTEHQTSTVLAPDEHRSGPADSPSLIPDSPSLIPNTPSHARTRAKADGPADDGFDAFWDAYPRKVDKNGARGAWRKLSPDAPKRLEIMAALSMQCASRQWTKDDGQFIPHPTTWLRQERWTAQLTPVRAIEREPDAFEVVRQRLRAQNTVIETRGMVVNE